MAMTVFFNNWFNDKNFSDFLFAFLDEKVFLKQIYSKRKELTTKIGLHSFKPSPQKKKKKKEGGVVGGRGGGVKF